MSRWISLDALLEAIDAASCPSFPDPMNVNSRRADGDTPLHIAATWGDVEAIEMLVRAGAEVDAIGDLDSTPLYTAVLHGHAAAARTLVEAGASRDRRDQFGRTATELAMRSGNNELMALFRGTP
jgi:ankyrin repeat protein